MTLRITPGVAPRLCFYVLDSDGNPVTDFDAAAIDSAGYVTITGGVKSSTSSISVGSDVAETAAHSTGQIVTIDASDGLYAIDAPAGAASALAEFSLPVIAPLDNTQVVKPCRHAVEANMSSLATQESVDAVKDILGQGSGEAY